MDVAEAPSTGTPQPGRKRPAVAAAIAPTAADASGATPARSTGSCAGLMASPRGSSLLTPEPAHKRRGVTRGGGGGGHAAGRQEGVVDNGNGGSGGSGTSATPTSVFTPGTNTAHLLLQLRRDCLQQHGQQGPPPPSQQQQQEQGQQGMPQEQPQQPPQQQQQQRWFPHGDGSAPPKCGVAEGDAAPGASQASLSLSEDASNIMRRCSYGAEPGDGCGSGSSGGWDSSFYDQRRGAAARSTTTSAAGGRGGGTRAPRGAGRGGGPASSRSGSSSGSGSSGGGRRGRAGSGSKPASVSESMEAGGTGGRGPSREGAAKAATSIGLDGCSCKKSMCLKLYCQCFAGQHVCSDACKCENCYNSSEHGMERRAAVRELLCRSPHAFDAKFKTEVLAADGGTVTARAVVHNTGCGCSKSACLKRYCECFNGGIACSDRCRCKDCRNTAGAFGARVRAKNMAEKSSMLHGGAAAAGAVVGAPPAPPTAPPTAALEGAPAAGARGNVTGRREGERRESSLASEEVAAAVKAAAVAGAAAMGCDHGIKPASFYSPMEHEEDQRRKRNGMHGKGGLIDVSGASAAAAAVARSPLGVLPGGIADGDDPSANRGTTFV